MIDDIYIYNIYSIYKKWLDWEHYCYSHPPPHFTPYVQCLTWFIIIRFHQCLSNIHKPPTPYRILNPGYIQPTTTHVCWVFLLKRKYLYAQLAGLHTSFGFTGIHCRTTRADYPRVCSELYDSRTATVADQQASFDSDHECCMCGYTDTNVQFHLQGTPGYCFDVPRGMYTCSIGQEGCGGPSSAYCVHDTGKVS